MLISRLFNRFFVGLVAAVLLVVLGGVLSLWWMRPVVTEERLREVVVTTVQREAGASFFVTGTLTITATSTVENTRYLFPDFFRFDLGTTRATVRMPGRVSYGFDAGALRAQHIRLLEGGLVEVTLPELSVFSVEPDLQAMEVETEVGWARRRASSGAETEQKALRYAQRALRQQGQAHLRTSTQPRVHTAQALQKLLTPVLQAAGLQNPRFRFRLGHDLVLEPEG